MGWQKTHTKKKQQCVPGTVYILLIPGTSAYLTPQGTIDGYRRSKDTIAVAKTSDS